ncbi:hypothetical protein ACFUJR_12045 [Streptomyces sp. NPDC057271]|uniref:hypothetical protein n=1 Tax=unclassified Streptomyces TaxID=2593676 RepID=UPI00363BEF12
MKKRTRPIGWRRIAVGGALAALAAAMQPTSAGAADIPVESRRYVFEVDTIKCVSETSFDGGSNSDEIYMKTTLPNSPLSYDTMYTATMGHFDAGDIYHLDRYHRAITPKIVHSDSYPDDVLFGSDDAWSVNSTGTYANTIKIEAWEEDGGRQLGGDDDFIDSSTYQFTQQGLALDIKNVGDHKRYTIVMKGSGAEYHVTLAVHRTR